MTDKPDLCRCSRLKDGTCDNLWRLRPDWTPCRCACHPWDSRIRYAAERQQAWIAAGGKVAVEGDW